MLKQMLLDCGAVQFGDFTLTSGRKSKFYVNIKKASTKPDVLREIARGMVAHVNADRLAGMELGAVPIAAALALETGLPYVIIRKEKREHGTGSQIEGELRAGEKVVVVEDVTTSGGSVVRSIEILRDAGAVVDTALVVVDREEGAKEALEAAGASLVPLVRISELVDES